MLDKNPAVLVAKRFDDFVAFRLIATVARSIDAGRPPEMHVHPGLPASYL